MAKSKHPIIKEAPCVSPAMDRRYQAEEDLRTLQCAGEVTGDKGRLKAAKAMAAEKARDLAKIYK